MRGGTLEVLDIKQKLGVKVEEDGPVRPQEGQQPLRLRQGLHCGVLDVTAEVRHLLPNAEQVRLHCGDTSC